MSVCGFMIYFVFYLSISFLRVSWGLWTRCALEQWSSICVTAGDEAGWAGQEMDGWSFVSLWEMILICMSLIGQIFPSRYYYISKGHHCVLDTKLKTNDQNAHLFKTPNTFSNCLDTIHINLRSFVHWTKITCSKWHNLTSKY